MTTNIRKLPVINTIIMFVLRELVTLRLTNMITTRILLLVITYLGLARSNSIGVSDETGPITSNGYNIDFMKGKFDYLK